MIFRVPGRRPIALHYRHQRNREKPSSFSLCLYLLQRWGVENSVDSSPLVAPVAFCQGTSVSSFATRLPPAAVAVFERGTGQAVSGSGRWPPGRTARARTSCGAAVHGAARSDSSTLRIALRPFCEPAATPRRQAVEVQFRSSRVGGTIALHSFIVQRLGARVTCRGVLASSFCRDKPLPGQACEATSVPVRLPDPRPSGYFCEGDLSPVWSFRQDRKRLAN